jgi:hypothetical protein
LSVSSSTLAMLFSSLNEGTIATIFGPGSICDEPLKTRNLSKTQRVKANPLALGNIFFPLPSLS